MSAPDLIMLRDLCFGYGDGVAVLDHISLHLAAGDKIALHGANGAGKSSLLRCILGLLPIRAGQIELFGTRCHKDGDFKPYRGRIGLLFQDSDDQLFCPTVLEDVMFGPLNQGKTVDQAVEIAGQTLADLGLSGFENRITYQLSGGEKRLVALATILAMRPEILLLDEPTNGLDPAVEERLTAILANLDQSMMIISHDARFLDRICNRHLILADGKIRADG